MNLNNQQKLLQYTTFYKSISIISGFFYDRSQRAGNAIAPMTRSVAG
jgi:hypothetical protein